MKKIFLTFLLFISIINFSSACHDWWDYAWDSSYSYDTTVSNSWLPSWEWYLWGSWWWNQINIQPATPTVPELPAWSQNDEQFKAIKKVIDEANWWWSQENAIKKVIDEASWEKNSNINSFTVDPAELKKACEGNDPTVASFRELAKQYNLVDPCENLK